MFINIKITGLIVYLETCKLIKMCKKMSGQRAAESKDPSECKMKVEIISKTRKLSNQSPTSRITE